MELQLSFEDFLKTVESEPVTKKSAEIRLDITRLAPQNDKKKSNSNNWSNGSNKRKSRKRKRSRKVWDNQELKEELERKKQHDNNNKDLIQNDDDNSKRAKTRVHLHKLLLHEFKKINNIKDDITNKRQKLNDSSKNKKQNLQIDKKKYDELNYLCNDIETVIFIKSKETINKEYMEYSRNLLFNLKKNKLLQMKLIKKELDPQQFVTMNYTELATNNLIEKRKQFEKERLSKLNSSSMEDSDIWIECAVQCTNCGHNSCKYRDKKVLFESTKSAVFGSASSKQQNVDMICQKCHYSFKYEISFN